MIIRKALPKDFSFIVQSQLAMADETEGLKLESETLIKGVNAVLGDSTKGQYWIVEKDNEPIGMCLTIPEWSDWRNGTVVWIHSVYTPPKFRGFGVFRALYSHLKQIVEKSPELKGLRLYVDKRNAAAHTVYARMGMNADHYSLFEWLK